MDRIIAFILCIIFFPFLFLIALLVKITSKGPVLFQQKRVGKNRKVFTIYKFRTMVNNAEQLKTKYLYLNNANGPVFKIYNDPRFTQFGKLLSRTGLDELPQLINIIKGEMSFVGPRPLPVLESKKIPEKYNSRFSVFPGITSPWVISGSHNLTFDQWMRSDSLYVKEKSFSKDIRVFVKTVILVLRNIILSVVYFLKMI